MATKRIKRTRKGPVMKEDVLLLIQNYIRNIQMNDYGKDVGIPALYAVMAQIEELPVREPKVLTNHDVFIRDAADINKLTEKLDSLCDCYDGTPWADWFGSTFCENCAAVKCTEEDLKALGLTGWGYGNESCGYCELHDRCRYFPQLDHIPTIKETILYWLEAQANESTEV